MKKAGKSRLVFVQFYQAHVWTCKQMRPYFVRASIQPKFRSAIFAEVDVDESEVRCDDCMLVYPFIHSPSPPVTHPQDLARNAGIKKVPAYQCYFEGQRVGEYEGGAVDKLTEFISLNLKEYNVGGGPLSILLKLTAAVALVAGGTLLATKLNNTMNNNQGTGSGGGGGGNSNTNNNKQDMSGQILDLKKRIMTAQGRLRNLEKANRGKQARAQRKLIEQLRAQVRSLEKKENNANINMHASSQHSGSGGGAKGAGKHGEKNGRGAGSGDGDGSGRPRGMRYDDVMRLRRKKARGEVLYSDEEDVLETTKNVTVPWDD